MRVLVRDKISGQYIQKTGVYTPILAEAVDFFCPQLANEFCERHKLKEHEILVAAEES